MIAIARHVLAHEAATRITLVYANRTSASTMFKEEIEDLKNRHLARFSLFALFSREAVESPLNAGRLDEDKMAFLLRTVIDARRIDHAFVCGPHGMNDAVQQALLDAGLGAERIHIERFGVPPTEADAHLHRTLASIREAGAKCGVAINPATPLSSLEEVLPFADFILVMSVNPGFGGQKFIPTVLDKLRRLKQMIKDRGLSTKIEIDGGIDGSNIAEVVGAGAEIIVAGSAVFGGGQPTVAVRDLIDKGTDWV